MKREKVWINKRFADIADAKVSVFDRGFLYGDGVFETMRSYAGRIFELDAHIDRLFKSLKVVKIRPPYPKAYFKTIIYKLLDMNGLAGGYIRLTITRGAGRFGIGYAGRFEPNVVIVAKEFGEYPAWMYGRGISARVVAIRQNERSPVSKIKSLNFLNYILGRLNAKEAGCDEAIFLNTEGRLAGGATSNIFLAKDENLVTPSIENGILPGVTRGVIINIAKRLNIRVIERKISYRELVNSNEVFLTNSLIEVLPVTRIDSRRIGSGNVGDTTKLLHISYQKQVIRSVLR